MKNLVLGIGALIAVTVAGVVLFTSGSDDSSSNGSSPVVTSSNQSSESTESTNNQVAQGGGVYEEYTSTAIADNPDKTKLIFFSAVWCTECRQVEKNIKAGSIPEDLVILKADYDTEKELISKYQVPDRTYFVQVDDNGERVTGWRASAFDGIDEILAEVI